MKCLADNAALSICSQQVTVSFLLKISRIPVTGPQCDQNVLISKSFLCLPANDSHSEQQASPHI